MILGVGADLIDIRRIQKAMERHGERFALRLFTEVERARAARKGNAAATFAKRFAAKEACSKALGTGLRRGVYWRDMGVVNAPSGRPTMALTGGAAARLAEMTPSGMQAKIHLSLSDDFPWAQAFIVISADGQGQT
jgi:holo-[acyl-carrier protein] synthase